MKYPVEIGRDGVICIQNVTGIGKGVEEILRFFLSNLRRSNIGITDGWDL
jgi:hypothetical protein